MAFYQNAFDKLAREEGLIKTGHGGVAFPSRSTPWRSKAPLTTHLEHEATAEAAGSQRFHDDSAAAIAAGEAGTDSGSERSSIGATDRVSCTLELCRRLAAGQCTDGGWCAGRLCAAPQRAPCAGPTGGGKLATAMQLARNYAICYHILLCTFERRSSLNGYE